MNFIVKIFCGLLVIGANANANASPSRYAAADQSLSANPKTSALSETKTQFVEQKDAGLIRDALGVFYSQCGFYPDQLDKLFEPTELQPSCLHGTKQAPLKPTPQNKNTIAQLSYTPFGYDDFELSIRLYWTRE